MAPRKSKTTAKSASSGDTGAKAYRHTRTGAIRFSTFPLGYPFEPVETKVAKADEAEDTQ